MRSGRERSYRSIARWVSQVMGAPLRKTFLVCGRCTVATVHTLLCVTDSDYEHFDADGYKGVEPATYNLFRCDGCTRVSVYIWSAFHSPQSEFGEQDYPSECGEVHGAPASVRIAYQQAERVKSRSKIAYAVLARRVLDAIVKDRCPEARSLSRGLDALAARGDIPPLLAEAAKHIRLFGNMAAHEAKAHFNEIHVQMIEKVLAVLVEHLYITPSALQEFKLLLDLDGQQDTDA